MTLPGFTAEAGLQRSRTQYSGQSRGEGGAFVSCGLGTQSHGNRWHKLNICMGAVIGTAGASDPSRRATDTTSIPRAAKLTMPAGIITAPLASGFGLTAYGNSGSQLTLCWRKADSNRRFRDALAPPTALPWCDAA